MYILSFSSTLSQVLKIETAHREFDEPLPFLPMACPLFTNIVKSCCATTKYYCLLLSLFLH